MTPEDALRKAFRDAEIERQVDLALGESQYELMKAQKEMEAKALRHTKRFNLCCDIFCAVAFCLIVVFLWKWSGK